MAALARHAHAAMDTPGMARRGTFLAQHGLVRHGTKIVGMAQPGHDMARTFLAWRVQGAAWLGNSWHGTYYINMCMYIYIYIYIRRPLLARGHQAVKHRVQVTTFNLSTSMVH